MFGIRFRFRVDSVKPSQLSQTWSTRLTWSTQSTFRHKDLEYCRMHASKSRLGNDITKSF
ncbi:hypothetical protein HanPI659440_Chr11g0425601 [Helianthus annuus]|nr:hypothetical protein HanPI659440_Chr11g0425601 [Helianthus annuus]